LIEILGSVVKAEPDWNALPADTPPLIRSLLHRCLQKERSKRLPNVADARFHIDEAMSQPVQTAPAVNASRGLRTWVTAALLLAALLIGATTSGVFFTRTPVVPEMRMQIAALGTDPSRSFALSPDGKTVVLEAVSGGKAQLWLRPLDHETAQPLAGTDGGFFPFWSSDGHSIGFFAEGKLKRMDSSGGGIQTLTIAPNGAGGSWNNDGIIIFAPSTVGPLYQVSSKGGEVSAVTELHGPAQTSHRFPYFLPDGKQFVLFVAGTDGVQGVYIASLEAKVPRKLFDADSAAVLYPPNYLLFSRQGLLIAQPVKLDTMEPTGDAVRVAEGIASGLNYVGSGYPSVERGGPILYRTGKVEHQLIWKDREGRVLGTVGEPDTSERFGLELSPDGRFAAFHRMVGGNWDVWLLEMGRGVFRRLTTNPAVDGAGVWSPDGKRFAFVSRRNGPQNVFIKSVDGTGSEEL
jgi:Tol biopolymer transport system component